MKQLAPIFISAFFAVSCMEYGPAECERFDVDTEASRSVIVMNEGNYMYGNASLSFYDPDSEVVENEVFFRANGFKLGDVAQSAVYHDGLIWVVVCNSGVIFALDPSTFCEVKRMTGFTAPRYMSFISPTKAYVTQIWDPRIFIVNPETCAITGFIDTGMDYETGSTEQMVQYDGFIYVNCWSMQNKILKIDTASDAVVGELVVGAQPQSMALDCNGGLWVLSDDVFGGDPSLARIDLDGFTIEKTFHLGTESVCRSLAIDAGGQSLYWINGGVWRMDVESASLPGEPFIKSGGRVFYALTTDPETGEIYASDAGDYVQNGIVLRYDADGCLLDSFSAGINPGNFLWRDRR